MRYIQETNKIDTTWFDINDECYNHRAVNLKYIEY